MAVDTIVFHQRFSLDSTRRTRGDERWIDVDHGALRGNGILHKPFSHDAHYANICWEGIRAKPHAGKLARGTFELSLINGDKNIARFLKTIEKLGAQYPDELIEIPPELEGLLKAHDEDEHLFLPESFTPDYVRNRIIETIQKNNEQDLITPRNGEIYVRPKLSRAANSRGDLGLSSGKHDIIFEIMLMEWGAYLPPTGLALVVYPEHVESSLRRFKLGANYALGSIAKNYANRFAYQLEGRAFHDALFTDGKRNIEEATGANFFVFENETTIVTPPLDQYILAGITRSTGIEIARNMGFTVREENIPIEHLKGMKAAYLTGTATGHCPIRVIYDPKTRAIYHFDNKFGPFLALQQEFDNLINGNLVSEPNRFLQERVRSIKIPL